MLKINVPKTEIYDENSGRFILIKEQTLQLEHSLVSISKWESKWHKPFLRKEPMTSEETIDYIRCMTITQNVDPMVYFAIDQEAITKINEYMEDSMTATWFSENSKKGTNEVITSERIYYWMIVLNIPVEFQKWHLNRLLTLIKICNIENSPKKKMKPSEVMKSNAALNAARRSKHKTKG